MEAGTEFGSVELMVEGCLESGKDQVSGEDLRGLRIEYDGIDTAGGQALSRQCGFPRGGTVRLVLQVTLNGKEKVRKSDSRFRD